MVVSAKLMKIPARQGKAVRLEKGQFVRVVNTHGSQVVDTWAFKADDFNELMSMEHTRSAILCLLPKVSCGCSLHFRLPGFAAEKIVFRLHFLRLYFLHTHILRRFRNVTGW